MIIQFLNNHKIAIPFEKAEIENEINLKEDGIDSMTIDSTVYVFGLADVAGEIMRFTTSTIGESELPKPSELPECKAYIVPKGFFPN